MSQASARPARVVGELAGAGIRVSLFIAADPAQIEAAAGIGAPVMEIHTGAWCDAIAAGDTAAAAAEFERIGRGVVQANNAGLEVHAGHGLDFVTAEKIAELDAIAELNIGHFLIGEAIFSGLGIGGAVDAFVHGPGQVACHGAGLGASFMILGIGSDITDVRRIAKVIERHGDRSSIASSRRSSAPRPTSGAIASRPTPNALPPRKPAPRRWARVCAPASGGAIWVSSICRAAARPWN